MDKEWWQEPGMDEEIDLAAWTLHERAELLPSQWKHIVSAVSTLVLCANRKDAEGVAQYAAELSSYLPSPPTP